MPPQRAPTINYCSPKKIWNRNKSVHKKRWASEKRNSGGPARTKVKNTTRSQNQIVDWETKEGKERSQGRYGSGIWVYGPCVLWQLPPKVAIWNMQFGSWLQRKTQETSNPWAQHARRTYVMWSEQKPIKKFRWPHNDQTGTWTDHLTKSQISSLNQSWEQKSKTVAKKNEK